MMGMKKIRRRRDQGGADAADVSGLTHRGFWILGASRRWGKFTVDRRSGVSWPASTLAEVGASDDSKQRSKSSDGP